MWVSWAKMAHEKENQHEQATDTSNITVLGSIQPPLNTRQAIQQGPSTTRADGDSPAFDTARECTLHGSTTSSHGTNWRGAPLQHACHEPTTMWTLQSEVHSWCDSFLRVHAHNTNTSTHLESTPIAQLIRSAVTPAIQNRGG